MLKQVVLLLTAGVVILEVIPLSATGNVTHNESECLLTEIGTRFGIVSKMIESIRLKWPKDLKELCGKTERDECTNTTRDAKPLDCSDIYQKGHRKDGLYEIWPQSRVVKSPLQVYCDMTSDGGGWTVIQRRGEFKRLEDYFYTGWDQYKSGFGNKLEDFWIGNDNLFILTNQRSYQLKVSLTDWEKNSTYAIYDEFWVDDEFRNYTLHVSGYSGTAGDSLTYSDRAAFSTRDRGNDHSMTKDACIRHRKGAWWYKHCSDSSLNGLYLVGPYTGDYRGVYWYTFRGWLYSLKDTVMMIRPASFGIPISG